MCLVKCVNNHEYDNKLSKCPTCTSYFANLWEAQRSAQSKYERDEAEEYKEFYKDYTHAMRCLGRPVDPKWLVRSWKREIRIRKMCDPYDTNLVDLKSMPISKVIINIRNRIRFGLKNPTQDRFSNLASIIGMSTKNLAYRLRSKVIVKYGKYDPNIKYELRLVRPIPDNASQDDVISAFTHTNLIWVKPNEK